MTLPKYLVYASFFVGYNVDFSQDVAVLILRQYPRSVLIIVLYSDMFSLETILQVNNIIVYACEIARFYLQGKSARGKCSLRQSNVHIVYQGKPALETCSV